GSLLFSRETVRREGTDIERSGAALDKIGHDLCRYWGKKDAITKMAGGDESARNIGWSQDGQIVRRAGAQARPALGDGSGRNRRNVFCSGGLEFANCGLIYRLIKTHIFHCRADKNL